jgi:uncharacterized membrane protein
VKTRATWTPRRIMALIVLWPVTAVAVALAIQLANPTFMQDAKVGGTPVVVTKPFVPSHTNR